VLVHGAWHGSWCWSAVTPLLTAAGRSSTAVDMEGHGLDAELPASALARPLDAAAFSSEPSPHAGVTLVSAADRLIAQIASVGRPVVLFGHRMSGHLITAAAQKAPQLVEPTRVVDLETSHSPFLSQPDRVASAILEA
jgi:pimeloyl-ACP methyl ester carboxylesterase